MDIDNEDQYIKPIKIISIATGCDPLNLLNQDALLEETWTFYAVKSGDVNFLLTLTMPCPHWNTVQWLNLTIAFRQETIFWFY